MKKVKKTQQIEKNERKCKKCTAKDDTSSSSAEALREGGTPHSNLQHGGNKKRSIGEVAERHGKAGVGVERRSTREVW